MKVIYIHHVPYRHLPPDFRSRYTESVVTNPYFDLVDPALVHDDLRHALDEAMHAARAGFDAVAVTEHSQSSYDMSPNPDLAAAAVAYATAGERLETGIYTVGRSLGKSREPLRIAEEQAWLDCLSGGRLICGFPVGLAYDANINAGVPPIETRARYDENFELVLRAWTERKAFPWNGRFSQYMHVNIWPRPVQVPHPPVNITGIGNPNTTRFALQRDLGFNLIVSGGAPGKARRVFDEMWRMADELGVDDNPYRAAFAQFVVVGNTDAEAEKLYAEHIEYSLANGIGYIPFHRLAMPGGISPQGMRALLQQVGGAKATGPRKYKEIVESGAVIAGGLNTVRDQLTELAQKLRIGNLLVFLQVGSMPHALAKYNIDMFASGVLPHLRALWPEYAAQNRWWPARLGGIPASSKQADPSAGRLK